MNRMDLIGWNSARIALEEREWVQHRVEWVQGSIQDSRCSQSSERVRCGCDWNVDEYQMSLFDALSVNLTFDVWMQKEDEEVEEDFQLFYKSGSRLDPLNQWRRSFLCCSRARSSTSLSGKIKIIHFPSKQTRSTRLGSLSLSLFSQVYRRSTIHVLLFIP